MHDLWLPLLAGVLTVSVMGEGILIIAILRVLGQFHQRLEQLQQHGAPGAARAPIRDIPDGVFATLDGDELRLSTLWSEGRVLLLFMSTGCPTCLDVLRRVGEVMAELTPNAVRACLLCAGPVERVREFVAATELPASMQVAAVPIERLINDYAITTTPTLVAIDSPGQIREVAVGSVDAPRLKRLLVGERAFVLTSTG